MERDHHKTKFHINMILLKNAIFSFNMRILRRGTLMVLMFYLSTKKCFLLLKRRRCTISISFTKLINVIFEIQVIGITINIYSGPITFKHKHRTRRTLRNRGAICIIILSIIIVTKDIKDRCITWLCMFLIMVCLNKRSKTLGRSRRRMIS